MVHHPKFQLFRGHDDLFYFRLLAMNGENLLRSEGYTAKTNAINGMLAVKAGAAAQRLEAREAKNGQHYFVVLAANHEIVGVSETYSSKGGLVNGMRAVERDAAYANAEDLTIEAPVYSNPKYQIFRGADNQFYFHLRARNGEIVLASEGYVAKSSARAGIRSVRNHVTETAEYFEREVAANGQYYFNLKAENGEIIGTSELFTSETGRDASIMSVIDIADLAPVEDTTVSNLIDLTLAESPEENGMNGEQPAAEAPHEMQEGESPIPNPKFQIFEGRDGQFYFRLRASNGEILLQSEGYTRKAGAELGIGSVKRHGKNQDNYQIRTAVNGQFYFVLRANNSIMPGQIIGVSELYVSLKGAENGIEGVIKIAANAPIEDTTLGALVYHNPKFELFKGDDGEFYFHLKARNGEILLQSEGYKSKSGAVNGIESVRKNAALADRFEQLTAEDGQFYFVLKAGNQQVIGVSETYTSEAGRTNGMESVMKLAPYAPVEDQTILEEVV